MNSPDTTGVAELGGPGGPWPPQKSEWEGQGMFWPPPPPKILTTGPPKMGPVESRLLLSTLKWAKFSKFFACGGLIREELISLVI